MIVDTHCHLDFGAFGDDREAVIDRAREAGVGGFVLIGISPESWVATRELAGRLEHGWRTAGIHPNSVADLWSPNMLERLRTEAASGELVAIGETGIDLYHSTDALERQVDAFREHIRLAKALNIPIVIHQRDAEQEVLDVLRAEGGSRGVMHCFGGDWNFAKTCLDLGLKLGIGGVATFKRSDATREAIRKAPSGGLVLETDAPFLAPQRWRGKRNEPAYLCEVVDVVASCRGIGAHDVALQTTENAVELFNIALG